MFYDKNGTELAVGDTVAPDEGRKLKIVSQGYYEEMGQEVMFGQQLADLAAFSILTQKNLSLQWTKVE